MLTRTYRRHRPDSSHPAKLVERNLLGQVKCLEHARIGEHDIVRDPAAGDLQSRRACRTPPYQGPAHQPLVWTAERVDRWLDTGHIPSPVMVWTPRQVGAFLDFAAEERLYALFHVVAFRGLRRGTEWTPRELRHSFVSLLSAHDIPIENISRLVGHTNTVVTETVYRKQIRPVIQDGAVAMNDIFPAKPEA
jgi:hypothetical protein